MPLSMKQGFCIMSTGWIKLHRKIFKNKVVCQDPSYFMVWCFLLTNAIHSEYKTRFNGEDITLKAGQLITSCREIERETGIDKSKVSRVLKVFKNEQQIQQISTPNKTLITIINWNEYQERNGNNSNKKHSETRNYQKVRHENLKSETRNNVVDKSFKRDEIDDKNLRLSSENENVRHENRNSETRNYQKVRHGSIYKNDIDKNDIDNSKNSNDYIESLYDNTSFEKIRVVRVAPLDKVIQAFREVKGSVNSADINTIKSVLKEHSLDEVMEAIELVRGVTAVTGERVDGFGLVKWELNRRARKKKFPKIIFPDEVEEYRDP